MNWKEALLMKCADVNAEPVIHEETLRVLCPETPPQDFIDSLKYLLPPGLNYEVRVEPKISTLRAMQELINRGRPVETPTSGFRVEDRHLTIEFNGLHEAVWPALSDVLKKDGFFKTWTFIIDGDEVYINPKVLNDFNKNKDLHGTAFQDDDILNLKIALECQSSEDFINSL